MSRTPPPGWRTAGVLALAAWTTVAGCGGGGGCSFEELRCSTAPPDSRPGAPAPPAVELAGGRVYLDLSSSMRGFIADRGSAMAFTPFQHLLDRLLDESFGRADLERVEIDGFGLQIERDVGPLSGFAVKADGAPSPAGRFTLASTDLARVVADVASHPDELAVIVTDGTQDLRIGAGSQATVGPGFNRSALVRELRHHWIDRGFGFWLVGLMSPFEGCSFNVIPNASGRVGTCVQVSRRPVYVWIASRDLDRGRTVVSFLVDELRRELPSAGAEADAVRAIEVWPGGLPVAALDVDTGPELGGEFYDGNLFRDVRRPFLASPSRQAAACIEFAHNPRQRLKVPLIATLEPAGGGLSVPTVPISAWRPVLPAAGEWSLTPADGAGPREANGRLRLVLELPYDTAAGYASAGRTLEIPIRYRLDLKRGMAGHWLQAWSTDDDTTPEAVEGRTLFLWDVVGGVLASAYSDLEPAACLHLRLDRS